LSSAASAGARGSSPALGSAAVSCSCTAPAVHVERVVNRFGATVPLAGSISRSTRAQCSACSDQTAPVRRRSRACWRRCWLPTEGTQRCSAATSSPMRPRFASCSGSPGSSPLSTRFSAGARTCRCSDACSASRGMRRAGARASCRALRARARRRSAGANVSQQLSQALLPWLAQIFCAIAVCSAGDALCGEPVPPYAAHVLGMIW
jgi:hypothetical protein